MELEIVPEPSEPEREAIAAALADDAGGAGRAAYDSAWRRDGLVADETD